MSFQILSNSFPWIPTKARKLLQIFALTFEKTFSNTIYQDFSFEFTRGTRESMVELLEITINLHSSLVNGEKLAFIRDNRCCKKN